MYIYISICMYVYKYIFICMLYLHVYIYIYIKKSMFAYTVCRDTLSTCEYMQVRRLAEIHCGENVTLKARAVIHAVLCNGSAY